MHPPLQIQIAPNYSPQPHSPTQNPHQQQMAQQNTTGNGQSGQPGHPGAAQQKMYYVDPLDELFQYQQSPSTNNSPLTSPCDGYFPPESPIYSPSYYQLHPPGDMQHRRHSSHEIFEAQKETRAASARNRRKQLSDSFEKLRMVLQPICGHIQSRQQLLESAISVIEEYQHQQNSKKVVQ